MKKYMINKLLGFGPFKHVLTDLNKHSRTMFKHNYTALLLLLIAQTAYGFPLSFNVSEKNPICFIETFELGEVS